MSYSPANKEVLIDQLRAVFVARGYDGATLANLASAVSLSKASLYHHFPGGKPEMASTLVRHAIADLQRHAFSHLSGTEPPLERLTRFIDGFSAYTHRGASDCLLAVFNHHSTAAEDTAAHQQTIAEQFADWHGQLASVFEEAGMKRKKGSQQAHDLLAAMYGALLTARMHNEPDLFVRALKRLKKRLAQLLTQP